MSLNEEEWGKFEEEIKSLGETDAEVLVEKGQTYGDSWKKRGGIGAFMMLARKWDRLENQCAENNYDILKLVAQELLGSRHVAEGVLDDIQDLRRYLLLVEHEARAEVRRTKSS